jgi:A/G-specific adenine glycosylase
MSHFQNKVWDFYHDHGRHDLPWRAEVSPSGVLVSEIMLQQTQVSRVSTKYAEWLQVFPSFEVLADSTVAEVVTVWQGLGYNRRALRMRQAAQLIIRDFGGVLPNNLAQLVRLPGVGTNTAGSVAAFAYNMAVVFIETNIRRVFLHEFFADADNVADKEILPLVEQELCLENPREWYWALMDYGADLTKLVENPNRRSRHYAVQTKFEGSTRQIRGKVLRQLIDGSKTFENIGITDERLGNVLKTLVEEGFVTETNGTYGLTK